MNNILFTTHLPNTKEAVNLRDISKDCEKVYRLETEYGGYIAEKKYNPLYDTIYKGDFGTSWGIEYPQKGNGSFDASQNFKHTNLGDIYLHNDTLQISGEIKDGKIVKINEIDAIPATYREEEIKSALYYYEKLLNRANEGSIKMNNTVKRFLKKSIEFLKTKV